MKLWYVWYEDMLVGVISEPSWTFAMREAKLRWGGAIGGLKVELCDNK